MKSRRLLLSITTFLFGCMTASPLEGQTPDVLVNRAIEMVEARDFRSAIALLHEVLALDSLQSEAYRQLAMAYLATEQSEAALRVAEAGLRHSPEDVGLELARADAIIGLGRLDEAVPLYRRLYEKVDKAINSPTELKNAIRKRLVSLYHAAAGSAYNAGDDEEAERLVKEAVALGEPDVELFRVWGAIALRQNEWSKGEEVARRGMALCGPDTSLLRIQAKARYELNDRAALLETAERLRSLLPTNADGDLLYADALILNERVVEGIAVLEEILRNHPERREVYAALAEIHRKRFDMKAAAGVLEQEARRFPSDAAVHLRLGEAWELAEQWEEARIAYRTFGILSGDSIASAFLTARTFERADSAVGAIREYRKILAWNGDQPDALMKLARLFLRMRRWNDALPLLQALYRTRPDGEVSTLLGWCLENTGNRREAGACYTVAVSTRTDDPLAYYRLSLMVRDTSAARAFELAETALRKALARLERTETLFLAAANDINEAPLQDRRRDREQYEESGSIAEAVFWFLAGSFPAADMEALLQRILPAHSESGRLHYLAGQFFRTNGDSVQSLARFESATRLTPGYGPAHAELGRELERFGRLGEALVSYERALALEPQERKRYEDVMRLSGTMGGLHDLARRWVARYRSNPGNAVLKEAVIEILHRTGKFDEAAAIIGEVPKTSEHDRVSR